jgi:hypothetical protein
MLIDIFPLFNEIEILQIRLAELYPHVDKFVIVENEYSFREDLFIYRLNGRVFSNNTKEVWCGNVVFKPSLLKKHSLTYIRDNIRGKQDERHMHIKSGWHFTSIGTNEQIYEKFKNWGHWSEIPILSIEFIDDCINQGKHFHSNSNLSVKYDNNLDFLPDSVVYSGMINEKYKHLIR